MFDVVGDLLLLLEGQAVFHQTPGTLRFIPFLSITTIYYVLLQSIVRILHSKQYQNATQGSYSRCRHLASGEGMEKVCVEYLMLERHSAMSRELLPVCITRDDESPFCRPKHSHTAIFSIN